MDATVSNHCTGNVMACMCLEGWDWIACLGMMAGVVIPRQIMSIVPAGHASMGKGLFNGRRVHAFQDNSGMGEKWA